MNNYYWDSPFPHCVVGDFLPSHVALAARKSWPEMNWDKWFVYRSPLESKRVCWRWQDFPEAVRDAMGYLLTCNAPSYVGGPPASPSDMLHGDGMVSMSSGDELTCHLDRDRHPLTGLERVCTAVVFLGEWRSGWGGHLQFWGPDRRDVVRTVEPCHNTLVVFRNTDSAFHSVSKCNYPEGYSRKVLMASWYGRPDTYPSRRPRALFVRSGRELTFPDPVLEKARAERAGTRPVLDGHQA